MESFPPALWGTFSSVAVAKISIENLLEIFHLFLLFELLLKEKSLAGIFNEPGKLRANFYGNFRIFDGGSLLPWPLLPFYHPLRSHASLTICFLIASDQFYWFSQSMDSIGHILRDFLVKKDFSV